MSPPSESMKERPLPSKASEGPAGPAAATTTAPGRPGPEWPFPGLDPAVDWAARPTDDLSIDLRCARFNLTDVGNGERLVALHGHDLVATGEKSWHRWDGRRRVKVGRPEMTQLARATIEEIPRQADLALSGGFIDESERAAAIKHAARSGSRRALRNMIDQAQLRCIAPEDFDQDDLLLNLANGTLDLRTLTLRPHDRRDLITKLAGTDFDPEARCPTWDRFLDEVLGGDKDLVKFVQTAVGLSLMGNTTEHAVFVLCGPDASGKAILIETITRMLGDYAKRVGFSTFLRPRRPRTSLRTDLAMLDGPRLVTATMVEEGAAKASVGIFSETTLKDLSGGDSVTYRVPRVGPVTCKPRCKLWLTANPLPGTDDMTESFWRRMNLIPFTGNDREAAVDRTRLLRELPGILNWALAGLTMWQANGLQAPAAVTRATAEYRATCTPRR